MSDLGEQIRAVVDEYNAVNEEITTAEREYEEKMTTLNQRKLDIELRLSPVRELVSSLGVELPRQRKRRSDFGKPRGPRNVEFTSGNTEEHQNPEFAA